MTLGESRERIYYEKSAVHNKSGSQKLTFLQSKKFFQLSSPRSFEHMRMMKILQFSLWWAIFHFSFHLSSQIVGFVVGEIWKSENTCVSHNFHIEMEN